MLWYPQIAQYPTTRVRVARTIVNEAQDGSAIRFADPGGGWTQWRLAYEELTDDEAEMLEDFFAQTEGSLANFGFVDPVGNLLAWSEDFDADAWEKDPQIQIDGTTVRNTGAAVQRIQQTVTAPAWFSYAFSLRASAPVRLHLDAAARDYGAGMCVLAGNTGGTAERIVIGVELAPGTAVELQCVQLEAQWGVSGYRKTQSSGGVYEQARFGQDELTVVTVGPNRHSCELTIIHADQL